EGFEPSKLSQQIYSLPPLATREPLQIKYELESPRGSVLKVNKIYLTTIRSFVNSFGELFNGRVKEKISYVKDQLFSLTL
ncbi:MAG: hypothetical protein CVV00_06875, partial [Firmicutes bacterium HGW-Firmicutes-5]